MSPSRFIEAVPERIWMLALVVGLPLLASVLIGMDANWDLRNYHLYNVHAWLGERSSDIAPAQIQTWHNPLLDVPLYLLVRSSLSLVWASLWLTVPNMVALAGLLRIQRLLSPVSTTRGSQLLLALLALTGAASLSTLGSSMNDSFVAASMLWALALVLDHDTSTVFRRWLFAGLLAGAMTGLKLAAVFYCIGFIAAALLSGGLRDRVRQISGLAVGGASGFALTYGYWAWYLFKRTGNPAFPYYNELFRSPWVLAEPYSDLRFRVETFGDALQVPVTLLQKTQEFCEISMSDPRLLAGLLSLATLGALHLRRAKGRTGEGRRLLLILTFFVTSMLVWALQFGIYRYLIALEMLACTLVMVALQQLPRWRIPAMLIVALLITADTRRPNWGRLHDYGARYGMTTAPIEPGGLVLIARGAPIAYVTLALPDDTRVVAVSNTIVKPEECTQLQARARQAVLDPGRPVWLLSEQLADAATDIALLERRYGLAANGMCRPVATTLGQPVLCPLRRATLPPRCGDHAELTVTPAAMSQCEDAAVARIVWRARATQPRSNTTQLWVIAVGSSEARLVSEGAGYGRVETGPWHRPGIRYELRDKPSGRVIAAHTVAGPVCAAD